MPKVKKSVGVNMSRPSPDRDLVIAASKGDVAGVKAALDAGANVHARTHSGDSTLMLAARYNPRKEVSVFIMDRGVDLRARNFTQDTALHNFARCGWCDLLEKALDAGCDIDALDNSLRTPLSLAAAGTSSAHLEAVKLLVRRGAKVICEPPSGVTSLNIRTVPSLEAALDAGLSTEAASSAGITLLMLASNTDDVDMCRTLLARGADMNRVTGYGVPAIGFAVSSGALNVMSMFLGAGAKTDYRTTDGATFEDLLRSATNETRAAYSAWRARHAMKQSLSDRMSSEPVRAPSTKPY